MNDIPLIIYSFLPSLQFHKNQRHTRDECIDKIFTVYARVSCKRHNSFMKVKEMIGYRWLEWRHHKLEHILTESMKSAPFLLAIIVPFNKNIDWNLRFFIVNVGRFFSFFLSIEMRKIQFSYHMSNKSFFEGL